MRRHRSLLPFRPEALEGRAYFAISFATPKFFEIAGNPANGAVVADFNSDGFDDVATAHTNSSDNNISVLLNTGSGGNLGAHVDLPAGQAPTDIIAGDFNGDSKLDLATTNLVDGTLSIFLNNGSGAFAAGITSTYGNTALVGTAATAYLETADLNADSILDIVVSNDVDSSVVTMIGVGSGSFTKTSERSISINTSPGTMELADFTNDGRPDVAIALGEEKSVFVLINAGDGSFSTPTPFALSGDSTGLAPSKGIATGDFNNDTKQDVALLFFPLFGSTPATAAVFLGNGDGTLQASLNLPVSTSTTATGLAAGDVDADGKLDIVVNGSFLGYQVYRGNGDGTFVTTPDATSTTLSVGGADAAGFGDLNNDDKLDIVFVTADGGFDTSNGVAVLLNGASNNGGGGGGGEGSVALTPTITTTLPAAVVAGQKVKGTASVLVTNSGTGALNGPVTVSLFASTDSTLDGNDAAVGTPTVKKLKLAAGASKAVKVKLSTLPTVADGVYRLIAKTTADGATEGTSASEATVNIAAPFVDLSGTLATQLPASILPGKKTSIAIAVKNNGNVAATESITIAITAGLSQTPSSGDLAVSSGTVKLNIKPGATKTIRVKTTVPAEIPANNYFLLAQIDSGNVLTESDETNNLVVSGTTITIGPT